MGGLKAVHLLRIGPQGTSHTSRGVDGYHAAKGFGIVAVADTFLLSPSGHPRRGAARAFPSRAGVVVARLAPVGCAMQAWVHGCAILCAHRSSVPGRFADARSGRCRFGANGWPRLRGCAAAGVGAWPGLAFWKVDFMCPPSSCQTLCWGCSAFKRYLTSLFDYFAGGGVAIFGVHPGFLHDSQRAGYRLGSPFA